MIHEKYYELVEKQNELLSKKNTKKVDFIMVFMIAMKILLLHVIIFHCIGDLI